MEDSHQPLAEYKWRVVAMLWTVSFFNYADRSALYTLFPLLEREMHLSAVQLGLLASSFAVTYGFLAPFAGNLVDRVSRKRAVVGGLYAWSSIAACTSLSRGFNQLVSFTAAEGVGESLYYPASMSLLSDYHGPETRSRAMGIHQTSVYVGTIAGGFFAGLIGEQYGWRWSFVTFGGMGLLLGLVLMRILREPARSHTVGVDVGERPSLGQVIAYLVNSPAAMLLLLGFCCANFVAMVLLSWMPKFLYDRFGLSVAVAGLSATLFVQLASMCGSPLGGWLADLMQKKRPGSRAALQSAALFCGAPFIVLCSQTRKPAVLGFALIVWGLCKGLYDANIFASMFDVVPAEARGTAAGVMNMIGWLCGGMLAPITIGFLSERIGLSRALGFTAGVYIIGGTVLLLASRLAQRETVRVLPPRTVNPTPVAPGN